MKDGKEEKEKPKLRLRPMLDQRSGSQILNDYCKAIDEMNRPALEKARKLIEDRKKEKGK
ncbi:hypothetical protein [Halobacillus sp. Nhm2S1]|uniref:hypothetical protein n=1 Tax=Halobacillus sp. Nhm2S1 TaxID=2866716 RepID=UPI001C73D2FC|nr:hypothetical protein [Halobacillus sp. Nhm2S1]MBX0356090.1 hypothetical protein [Halobacillus sp. Nhm2S1]